MVWCQDEAGPSTTAPYGGESWEPEAQPHQQSHEYLPDGTAKLLTLFHPASGQVVVKGVTSSTNRVLHGWLHTELEAMLATMPAVDMTPSRANRAAWDVWQEGLTIRPTLLSEPPPLRMLLIWDNLAGHKTPEMVVWLFCHGIMPLYTPLGGSWLGTLWVLAETVQRIVKRRALNGHHPKTTSEISAWLEATARGWNQAPTPFIWAGKRAHVVPVVVRGGTGKAGQARARAAQSGAKQPSSNGDVQPK